MHITSVVVCLKGVSPKELGQLDEKRCSNRIHDLAMKEIHFDQRGDTNAPVTVKLEFSFLPKSDGDYLADNVLKTVQDVIGMAFECDSNKKDKAKE